MKYALSYVKFKLNEEPWMLYEDKDRGTKVQTIRKPMAELRADAGYQMTLDEGVLEIYDMLHDEVVLKAFEHSSTAVKIRGVEEKPVKPRPTPKTKETRKAKTKALKDFVKDRAKAYPAEGPEVMDELTKEAQRLGLYD